jgi:hypothetical protein
LAIVVGLGFMAAFTWLLVRNWGHRPLRHRLLGNILLISLLPASVIVPDDNLVLVFAVAGGLLIGGLGFRIVAEREERV